MGTSWTALYWSMLRTGGCYDRDNPPAHQEKIHNSATQNKCTTAQEGDRNLSTDRICATCCWKMHLGSTQCCMKTGLPRAEGM